MHWKSVSQQKADQRLQTTGNSLYSQNKLLVRRLETGIIIVNSSSQRLANKLLSLLLLPMYKIAWKEIFTTDQIRFYLGLGAAYLLLRVFGDSVSESDLLPARWMNHLWLVILLTFINAIFFEYALPIFKLTWRRILLGIFVVFGFCMIYSFGLAAWRQFGISLNLYTAIGTFASPSEVTEYTMSYSVSTVVFFAIVRHVYNYRRLKLSAQQLRIEKQEAELNYLKSQTNPHFLFNTLNNIYSLARDESELAPEAIMRLSKILRFMLYETSGAYISIEKELKIIQDYIELEKLRYDESLRINYNHDVEDMKQALPPLLLIPLVENAFKHGVSETRSKPFVDIHLSVKNRELSFSVRNSTEEDFSGASVQESLGLSNLRRQLELLYTRYTLQVGHEERTFVCNLKIDLKSHV